MFFKDLLFPKLCLGCNTLGSYICLKCQEKLRLTYKDICIYCQKSSYMGLTHMICKKTLGIDVAIGFYPYSGILQKVIKHIKYRGATDVWREFCQIIQPKIYEKLLFYKQLVQNGLVQPVPLHSAKMKIRGFNQSLLISNFFNVILKFPVVDYFIRVKNTLPQASLYNKKKRYLNMKSAFMFTQEIPLKGETLVIIDDVITSGSTIFELCKAIKKCGAEKVFTLALARG